VVNRDGVRVGVVGCGYWGSKHVRVLSGLDTVDQVAVIDSNPNRVMGLVRSFPAARAFSTLGAALDSVDALVIATPPTLHVPLALQAMSAGKHVLVEKPLATTSADASLLIDTAEEAGVQLMVGHTFEHNAAVWKLRALVQSGQLGDLYYLDTARLNLGLYQSDVNVIFDLAPHDISVLNFVLGVQPDAVHAWGAKHAHRSFEDVAYLRLSYDALGICANVHVSWLDPCKVRRVTAVGSRQMAVYNDLSTDQPIRIFDKGVELGLEGDLTQPPMSYRYGDVVAPYVPANEPLAVQDEHFVNCIRAGVQPRTDGANGQAVVDVLECAQMSITQGRTVRLDEVRSPRPDERDADAALVPAVT
jgi:predicted dehydrogenase